MRMIRILTHSGQVRIAALGDESLESWWARIKSDGHAVCPAWAMPFDEIALVDVFEAEVTQESQKPAEIDRLAAQIRQGQFSAKDIPSA